MKKLILPLCILLINITACTQNQKMESDMTNADSMNYRKLTPEEERVIVDKGTERPFTGIYNDFFEKGTYVCKRCGSPLFRSTDKFKSSCGWPSFDDEIPGAVKRIPDPDGMRTEIVCAYCGAHLGHVFEGEGLTPKDVRNCVNSVSLLFIPDSAAKKKNDTAIFAGGCFWGVEYYMQKEPGVISTDVGYIGGHTPNPTYEDVCSHTTGYAEAVRIVYDPSKTTYEKLARLFFEIHDPTQMDHQGPDYGDQYRSEIFYLNGDQKKTAEKLIGILKDKGYDVVTQLAPATKFYMAENYHQDYYERNGHTPYCHGYVKRF